MILLGRRDTMGKIRSDITDLGKLGNRGFSHSMLLDPTIIYNKLLKFKEKKANPYRN